MHSINHQIITRGSPGTAHKPQAEKERDIAMIYRAEKFSADDVMEETERKIDQAHALVNAIACSPNAVSESEVCGILNFLDVVSEQFRECMKAFELIQGTEAQGIAGSPLESM